MVKNLQEINKDLLITFQNNSPKSNMVIIKFGAEWCKPCKLIKNQCDECVSKLKDNIGYVSVDIDEEIELYAYLKTKKQINGVPTLLAYYAGEREKDKWYIPDDSVVGADKKKISDFFERCNKYLK